MTNNDPGAWFTLNTRYYAAPVSNPQGLLHDSQLFLQHALGVARLARDAVQCMDHIDKNILNSTLAAIVALIDMGNSSVEVAVERYRELGDYWNDDDG